MPKKRFTAQYSKPPSTVHSSLTSASSSGSSHPPTDAPSSVNDLISSLRKSQLSSSTPPPPTIRTTHTLPPQIRHLLSEPEGPLPRPRTRSSRRIDEFGHRIPAGPPPPRSWALQSRYGVGGLKGRGQERVYPVSVEHLPGLNLSLQQSDGGDGEGNGGVRRKGRRLQDMVLRTMAREWEFVREWEKNNLADLPTRLRILLLSHIAVHGPEEGVGSEALHDILLFPSSTTTEEGKTPHFDVGEHNAEFFRLDLSGSMGRSITFTKLIELVQKPSTPPPSEEDTQLKGKETSWEDNLNTISITAPLPYLTHLSLSHPSPTISWPRLLAFTKHIPCLTHLSLAFWPTPSLLPNSKTAYMSSDLGGAKDIQYSSTNYYSHSLDNDFREAAEVLRRLASRLYSLEYLDLMGCMEWWQALRWRGEMREEGLEWNTTWVKLSTLILRTGLQMDVDSPLSSVTQYCTAVKEAKTVEFELGLWSRNTTEKGRRGNWIEVMSDDWRKYMGELERTREYRGGGRRAAYVGMQGWVNEEREGKLALFDELKRMERVGEEFFKRGRRREEAGVGMGEGAVGEVERRSVWDQ